MAKPQCDQPPATDQSPASRASEEGNDCFSCEALRNSNRPENRRQWLRYLLRGAMAASTWGLIAGRGILGGAPGHEPPESQATSAEAPQSLEERCVAELETLRSKNRLIGLVAGAFDTEGRSLVQSVGLRKQDRAESLTIEDKLHLGSCTKAMTATLIAIAVDEGELNWDSSLRKIFADDRTLKESSWANATIDDLLHHTSGLPINADWNQLEQTSRSPMEQRTELLRWVAQQPQKEESQGKFLYSNVGYVILGHVLEQLWKRSWEEIIQLRLFEPLGITSAGFGPPDANVQVDQPWGHRNLRLSWEPSNFDNPAILGPAGRVHMTICDWAKFALLHTQRPKPGGLISTESWEHIHKPYGKMNYAGGWIVFSRPWAKDEALMHTGSNNAWYCVAWIAPKIERAFLAVTNGYSQCAEIGCDRAIAWMVQAVEKQWKR